MQKLAEKRDTKIVKVGTKNSEGKIVNYRDIHTDEDGWARADLFLPPDFELCLLKTGEKTVAGWHMRNGWDGHRLLDTDIVLYWKRKTDYNNECAFNGKKQR